MAKEEIPERGPEGPAAECTDEPTFHQALVAHLRSVDSYSVEDIATRFESPAFGRDFKLALWRATEELRRDTGITFVPNNEGLYVRADARQKHGRGRRFIRAAGRKTKRAHEILESVNPADLKPEERHSFELARDKAGQLVTSQNHIRHLRRPDPTGCSIPTTPKPEKG